jgi:hypothetical protein
VTKMKDVRRNPLDTGLPKIVRRRRVMIQTIPTGNIRHLPSIREGRLNYAEHFSKRARARIPLDPGVEEDLKRGRGKAVVIDAGAKLQQGRAESQARDAEKIRKRPGVLREGKEARGKGEPDKSRKQNVQKRRSTKRPTPDKPPKVKAKDKTPQKPKPLKKRFVKRQEKGGK